MMNKIATHIAVFVRKNGFYNWIWTNIASEIPVDFRKWSENCRLSQKLPSQSVGSLNKFQIWGLSLMNIFRRN